MSTPLNAVMTSAMRLIRERKLSEATASIQNGLQASVLRQPTRPLREVVETLRLKKPTAYDFEAFPKAGTPEARRIPEGARILSQSFSCAAGRRDYNVYIPSGNSEERRPLLIMLHGCTQNPDDFATGTRMNAVAELNGMLVAYPGQSKAANPSACWN